MSNERLARLRSELVQAGFGGLVLVPAANLTYISGLFFHHPSRLNLVIIPAADAVPCYVIPALEMSVAQAKSQIPMRYFPWHDSDGPAAALQAALHAALDDAARQLPLGIEFTEMKVRDLRAIEAASPAITTADATALLASVRMVKADDEIANIETAVRMVEAGLQATIAAIRPGMTERQLSQICREAILAQGADDESFANIVASGPNGANPHHQNSDRAFQPGDLIILDCGARYNGYISDITRTVAFGEPSAEVRRIYETVQAANAAGRAAVAPGRSGAEIDRATRQVIEAAGYGEYFIHRTGHGFGMETHELPNIVGGSDTPLKVGTTFTIEPGVYIPGLAGVRIEDDMVITAEGGRSLTSLPRDLLIIPTEA